MTITLTYVSPCIDMVIQSYKNNVDYVLYITITMNIQQALDIVSKASNTDHLKYFKEQTRHFKLEPSSSLKQYFDRIYQDTLTWLQTLPSNAKSKSTFNKYKASVYLLLEQETVVAELGSQYCDTVIKAIKECFKENIDNVVKHREKRIETKPEEVIAIQEVEKDEYKEADEDVSDNECMSDIASEGGSVIDIETVMIAKDEDAPILLGIPKVADDDYKTAFNNLSEKYIELHTKYNEIYMLYNELQRKHNITTLQLVESNAVRRTIEKDKEQMWKLLALALKS
jgi:hypothetical protein